MGLAIVLRGGRSWPSFFARRLPTARAWACTVPLLQVLYQVAPNVPGAPGNGIGLGASSFALRLLDFR